MTGHFQTKKFQQSSLWLFYIGLALILFSLQRFEWTGFTPTFIEKVQFILNRLGLGLLVLRLLSLAPAYPRYVLASFCLVAVFWFSHILSVYSGKMNLYYVVLVAAASRGADEKVALKLYLAYLVFFLVICPVSHALGLTGNVLKHIGQLQGGSFGFSNPNYLARFIAMAASLGLYLSNSRRLSLVCIISWVSAAFVAILTLNRTFTLLMLALPVFYLLFERKKPEPWMLAVLPAACLAISIILAWCYGPGYGSNTFESRFSIPALVYQKFGLSLFGQYCGLDRWANGVWPYLNIDNGYLILFICEGVVTGLVAMGFFTHLMYLIGRRGDALLSAVACCIAISGTMESVPFNMYFSFLPLLYMSLVDEFAPESRKAADAVALAMTLGAVLYVFMPWLPQKVQPSPYGTVGEIPPPEGFVPVESGPDSFSGYVGSLLLARPDSVVTGYDGTPCDTLERFCYRVVDFPLIDKNEQCADVCMRLEAEYLYGRNRFRKIRFADTRGKELRYRFGACRPLFDRYLKKVFGWSSTKSMCASMPVRPLNQIVPGDVFVYDEDAREGKKYGHAVMVAKVAVDPASGRKAVLLIQGSTPACDIHVVANPDAPDLSPWHLLREPSDSSASSVLSFAQTVFYANDLRYFTSSLSREEDGTIPSYVRALIEAYPDIVVGYEKGSVVFRDGTKITCDDGKRKDYRQRLDDTDIEDMFQEIYPLEKHDVPGYLQDPGRYRCEAFFKKVYGNSARKVRRNLVTVDWYGQKIPFTRINHAADSLVAVQREMKSRFPDLKPFFKESSSFNWRKVRGADRLSAHSFGMAIDISVQFSDYWRWNNPGKNETDSISYCNRIPAEIVDVFEKHGFISGTKWYHYDTMHFEFRPDLLIYAGF